MRAAPAHTALPSTRTTSHTDGVPAASAPDMPARVRARASTRPKSLRQCVYAIKKKTFKNKRVYLGIFLIAIMVPGLEWECHCSALPAGGDRELVMSGCLCLIGGAHCGYCGAPSKEWAKNE